MAASLRERARRAILGDDGVALREVLATTEAEDATVDDVAGLVCDAAAHGSFECVLVLLRCGCGPSFPHGGQTPLHLAAAGGHAAVVRLLLEWEADPAATDDQGRTPLHLAAAHGHVRTLVTLLGRLRCNRFARDKNKHTALHAAVMGSHASCVRELLRGVHPAIKYVDKACAGATALHMAASLGHVRTVKKLLAGGADYHAMNVRGKRALHLAAAGGHARVVKVLLAAGAGPGAADDNMCTALHDAASRGRAACVDVLARHAAGQTPPIIDARSFTMASTALHLACTYDAPCVCVLLDHGADIEARNSVGLTPLHVAATIGRPGITRILVDRGADIEVRGPHGVTPLMLAASHSPGCVKELLERGADVRARDSKGATALHIAARLACGDTATAFGFPTTGPTLQRVAYLIVRQLVTKLIASDRGTFMPSASLMALAGLATLATTECTATWVSVAAAWVLLSVPAKVEIMADERASSEERADAFNFVYVAMPTRPGASETAIVVHASGGVAAMIKMLGRVQSSAEADKVMSVLRRVCRDSAFLSPEVGADAEAEFGRVMHVALLDPALESAALDALGSPFVFFPRIYGSWAAEIRRMLFEPHTALAAARVLARWRGRMAEMAGLDHYASHVMSLEVGVRAPEPKPAPTAAETECRVCMKLAPLVVQYPCGHRATCAACMVRIQHGTGTCPVCRSPVLLVLDASFRIYDC